MKLISPAYGININGVNCQFEITCNNVIIFEYKSKSSANKNGVSIGIPINHILLKNGEFNFGASILPTYGEEYLEESSSLNLELYMLDYIAPKKTFISLLKLRSPKRTDPEKPKNAPIESLKGLPRYELFSKFIAKALPFNEKGWLNSIDLSKLSKQKLILESYNFYEKIYSIISNKSIGEYLSLVEGRDKILETTYYYGQEQILREKRSIKKLMEEPGLNLLPIRFEDVKIELMGNSKLVRLVRKNNLPLLMFYNPLNRKTVQLNLKLHKKTATSEFSII